MSFKKTRIESKPLTPELVAEFNALPGLPSERDLKLRRLKYQLELIQQGRYIGVDWAIALDKSTGTSYRGNGNHSRTALSNLPANVKFPTDSQGAPLVATITTWEMDSMADSHDLFNVFDNPQSVRNNVDYMTMVKVQYPDVKRLPAPFLINATNAINEALSKEPDGESVPARFRGDELLDEDLNREWCLWLSHFLSCDNADFIKRTKAMAVCYLNWREDQEATKEVWGHIFNQDEPDTSDSYQFAEELKAARNRIKRGDKLRQSATRIWKRYLREHTRAAA